MPLELDATLNSDIDTTAVESQRLEGEGFATAWVGESKHDAFLRCHTVASATTTLRTGTAVAIAFGRSPLTVAHSAYDLARTSRGRFTLGLGSQVKAHIERRFSMPWSSPASRMREFVVAVRAIWTSWETESTLDFDGEFYKHTLMPPFFRPPLHAYGAPPVYLAAVGPRMTEGAGEVADGMFFHPFTTVRYLREVTLPALSRGARRAGRSREDIALVGPVLTATGRNEDELAFAIDGVKRQIAFYASTPTYLPVLELHAWAEIGTRLSQMAKQGRWAEMGTLIDDDMLTEFAVVGSPAQVANELRQRFGPLARSVSFSAPYEHDRAIWNDVRQALNAPTNSPI